MGSSRGVLDDLQSFTFCQGYQSLASLSWNKLGPIRVIILEWPLCDSHINRRLQLLHNLDCILMTWLNPCLELVVPRVPGSRCSWELVRLGNAFQLTSISNINTLLHILMDLELLIHNGLKCLCHSSCSLRLLTCWLLECLLKLLLPLGQLLNHLHQHLLIACLWTCLWLLVHSASAACVLAWTETVRHWHSQLLMLDLRTPAPLPCKDILGSYTYLRLCRRKLNPFTLAIKSSSETLKWQKWLQHIHTRILTCMHVPTTVHVSGQTYIYIYIIYYIYYIYTSICILVVHSLHYIDLSCLSCTS